MTLALHGKSAKRQAVLIVGAMLAILLGSLAVFASGGAGAKAGQNSQYHQDRRRRNSHSARLR